MADKMPSGLLHIGSLSLSTTAAARPGLVCAFAVVRNADRICFRPRRLFLDATRLSQAMESGSLHTFTMAACCRSRKRASRDKFLELEQSEPENLAPYCLKNGLPCTGTVRATAGYQAAAGGLEK
jgi:hypothetical protein